MLEMELEMELAPVSGLPAAALGSVSAKVLGTESDSLSAKEWGTESDSTTAWAKEKMTVSDLVWAKAWVMAWVMASDSESDSGTASATDLAWASRRKLQRHRSRSRVGLLADRL